MELPLSPSLGGLAGSEAALQIARLGVRVRLIDMKPGAFTPAHTNPNFGELVCSNSLRGAALENAVGLLKEELRRLGSALIAIADECKVPAGGALAVDREIFAEKITYSIMNHPLIDVIEEKIDDLPTSGINIIATGPLTEGNLFASIKTKLNIDELHFFDAAAPIITEDSINYDVVFRQSRYDKGDADYLNCPLDRDTYEQFWQELIHADLADVHDFDKETVFEGCMPVETMAKRGHDTLLFGPLKPVGLKDPKTGKQPFACVQLRQDNRIASLYNLVGFQTRLTFGEQRRVFRMIPGLEQAEFVRYGVMHRNTFLNSPKHLTPTYSVKNRPDLYIAGQMTGVEGYVESMASGFVAGINAAYLALDNGRVFCPDDETMIGALAHYISDPRVNDFQPMNANFGLIAPLKQRIRKKRERNLAYAERSLTKIAASFPDLLISK